MTTRLATPSQTRSLVAGIEQSKQRRAPQDAGRPPVTAQSTTIYPTGQSKSSFLQFLFWPAHPIDMAAIPTLTILAAGEDQDARYGHGGTIAAINNNNNNSSTTTTTTEAALQAPVETNETAPSPAPSASSAPPSPLNDAMPHHSTGVLSRHRIRSTMSLDPSRIEIRLTPREKQLFDVLVGTANAYNEGKIELPPNVVPANDTAASNTAASESDSIREGASAGCGSVLGVVAVVVVRVAGGWVRDKILGVPTHDIDIAVDQLSGVQFATLVQHYLQSYAHHPEWAGRMGIIAANPDQSKHLETATMKVCGLEVDFCHLRSQEVYQDHSRIPIVEIGTALDDAQRRDFTLNALFYNLHTQQVEDWLQRGYDDLRNGLLVTPLNPLQTFHDDPLRVLRAIRFAVRYHLQLDPALENAAQHIDIHRALHVKVSRERVGKELEGMLSGKGARPVEALQLISHLKLAGSVFCLPWPGVNDDDNVQSVSGSIAGHAYSFDAQHLAGIPDAASDPQIRHVRELGWEEARRILDLLPNVVEPFTRSTLDWTGEGDGGVANASASLVTDGTPTPGAALLASSVTQLDSRLLPLAVFLLPFRKLTYRQQRKQKDFSAISYVVRESIKFKTVDVTALTLLLDTVDDMADLLKCASSDAEHGISSDALGRRRLQVGLLLRRLKDLWVTSVVLGTVLIVSQVDHESSKPPEEAHTDWVKGAIRLHRQIVCELRLDQCWKVRPLLDGTSIIKELGLPRGPQVAQYLDEQVKWMLQNPHGTKEQCEDHLRSLKRRWDDASSTANQDHDRDDRPFDEPLGMSDGTGKTPSSPITSKATVSHFSKKMHVESMDIS